MDYKFSFEIGAGLAAVLGTLFGGGISIFGIWLQTKNQTKREYIKLAKELAVEEHRRQRDIAVESANRDRKTYIIHPIESFITYYVKYFDLMHKNGAGVDQLNDLNKFRKEMYQHYEDVESPILKTTARTK